MSTFKPSYNNGAALTITIAGLASTVADPPVGQEALAWDNSSSLFEDAFVYGKIRTGTSPTAGRLIQLCAALVGYDGTNYYYPAGLAGSNGAITPTFAGAVAMGLIVPIISIPTDGTSSKDYKFGAIQLAPLLQTRFLTRKVAFFLWHNTAVNLDSTAGNHAIYVEGINGQSV
jgi:hypothetical protein